MLWFILQLLELIFPKAEALKKKLKEKYTAEENKRLAELVSSEHLILIGSCNFHEYYLHFLETRKVVNN